VLQGLVRDLPGDEEAFLETVFNASKEEIEEFKKEVETISELS
jgi:hypothetical protein